MSEVFGAFLLFAAICWIFALYEFFADLKHLIEQGEVIKMLFLIVIFPFVFLFFALPMVVSSIFLP